MVLIAAFLIDYIKEMDNLLWLQGRSYADSYKLLITACIIVTVFITAYVRAVVQQA